MLSQCNAQMKISFPGLIFAQYKSINIISLLLLLLLLLLLSSLLLLLLLLLVFVKLSKKPLVEHFTDVPDRHW